MSSISDRLSAPKALRVPVGRPVKVGSWLDRLVSKVVATSTVLVREWQTARDLRRLSGMSDAMLHDIGVSRGAIEAAVRHGRDAAAAPSAPSCVASRLPASAVTEWR
ncbi:DUF1127 domain-containing protein [Microvirga massiliensis]|uniref:DUF1127 domain-containing protein n=1 Tax=Microvirga massiliensis TaxID=1033741 RepID=UPI00062BD916|nr:DUF1127 domain-containing protein [Microvirga massiliensis]